MDQDETKTTVVNQGTVHGQVPFNYGIVNINNYSKSSQTHAQQPLPPEQIFLVPYPRNLLFTGREEIIRLLSESLTQISSTMQIQVITGFGGVGKTQTVLEYVYRYQANYQAIFWIRAGSREEIIEDLTYVAHLLQLPQQSAQDQQQVVDAVKCWLQIHQGWLLVVDNADDLNMIYDYLPIARSGHILLTTRAQAIGNIAQKIELSTMLPSEGIFFLLKRAGFLPAQNARLEDVSVTSLATAQKIVQEVGYLPLAIDQAGAYLEETGENLESYLTLYQSHRKDLLARRGGIHADHVPVATTWSLAISKVSVVNPAAIDLMHLCAFLAPDSIAEEILTEGAHFISPNLKQAAENRITWNQIIEELRKYSLIYRQSEIQTISIHPLVQAVIYDTMDRPTQLAWTNRAVSVVEKAFPLTELAPWSQSQRYILDALACLNHATLLEIENSKVRNLRLKTAMYLQSRGQFFKAEVLFKQVLFGKVNSKDPIFLESRHNLAFLYSQQGKYEQAKALFQQVITDFEQVLEPENPIILTAYNNLAGVYSKQGKYEQAKTLLQKILTSQEIQLGLEHPSILDTRHNMALLFLEEGKYEQAEVLFQQVLKGKEKLLDPEHPLLLTMRQNLALLYSNQGKYEQAEALYQQVLKGKEKLLGPEHPEILGTKLNLANLYYHQHKYEQAEALNQQILADSEHIFDFEHPNILGARESLALAYKGQKNMIRQKFFSSRSLPVTSRYWDQNIDVRLALATTLPYFILNRTNVTRQKFFSSRLLPVMSNY